MATDYYLFPDRREKDANAFDAVSEALGDRLSPDEALPRLRRIDWAHPALVVYREDGDDRWSYVTLGLNTPELGEG